MGWLRWTLRTPCLVLLLVQLLGVLAYPFMESTQEGRSAFAIFGLLVLGTTLLALRATPLLTWVAALVAAPSVVLLAVNVFRPDSDLYVWSAGFEMVLYFYAAISMLFYMLDDERVTTDELFATVAVFTLLAWAFAYLFVVVQGLDPQSFNTDGQGVASWMELLFLSFTTLSSTGLSDIVPRSGHARSINMIEQVAGLFYIAMVVTRPVSLNRRRHST